MKTSKLAILFLAIGMATNASAVTVSIGAGIPAQGITFQVDYAAAQGFASDSYFYQIGHYDMLSSVWTPFGAPASIIGELKGSVTATAPASLENLPIHIYVGTAATAAECVNNSWVIFESGSVPTPTFPAPITGTGAKAFNATLQTNTLVLRTGNPDNGYLPTAPTGSNAAFNLVTVPEASTALLGLIGLAGLVRRRR